MFTLRALSCIVIAALATLVLAKPAPVPQNLPSSKRSSCSTGTTSCCNTIVQNDQPSYQDLAGILPIGTQGVGAPIAVGCSPISTLGGGAGASCSSQATCCTHYHGTYGVNCSLVGL